MVVHGDDFTNLGTDGELDWLKGKLAEKFEIPGTIVARVNGSNRALSAQMDCHHLPSIRAEGHVH